MPDRYAVMGNPIEHSLSPTIHGLFAKQTNQDISYEKILVGLDDFKNAIFDFRDSGGKGCNVTLPFKQEAYALADECSDAAKQAEAVNTLYFTSEGKIYGDNTDGPGLCRDLELHHQIHLHNAKILILGASGAARGVIGPLLSYQPQLLHIANRTAAKATKLSTHFGAEGNVTASSLSHIPSQRFDLIINATSASLSGCVPDISPRFFQEARYCYDLAYGAPAETFIAWARKQGCQQVYDGLGMLVEQAAESFYLWRRVHPETTDVIRQLYQRN